MLYFRKLFCEILIIFWNTNIKLLTCCLQILHITFLKIISNPLLFTYTKLRSLKTITNELKSFLNIRSAKLHGVGDIFPKILFVARKNQILREIIPKSVIGFISQKTSQAIETRVLFNWKTTIVNCNRKSSDIYIYIYSFTIKHKTQIEFCRPGLEIFLWFRAQGSNFTMLVMLTA